MNGMDDHLKPDPNDAPPASTAAGQPPDPELVQRIKRAEEQLLQSEKLATVGLLAAGIAHEINNPVGFVSSNLGSLSSYVERLFALIDAYEQLAASLPADHPGQAAVAAARAAADLDYLRTDIPDLLQESVEGLARVKGIISDLKDFSRVEAAEWKEADLNRGLDSTLNVVWNEIKYKAQVCKEYGELPPVRCISSQINQVFMNLLVNAAQAIENSGVITLSTGVADEQVWIEIRDTGKGMRPEVQAKIFEPFFTTKPVGKGTGLGLSISHDIIQRHQGDIAVRSALEEGTTFRLTLPIAGPPPEP
jgi:two-component system, NtrC family, sensor kinase